MDKEEKSDPLTCDFSTGPWAGEEATKETASFQSFKRPATPSEYTENLETKATDSEPDLPEDSTSVLPLDNLNTDQESSQQLGELRDDMVETSENSSRVSESHFESAEDQQLSPRHSPSNLLGTQESQQQLVRFDSSPERIDSLHDASDTQECPQQQFSSVLDETITNPNSSPSQEQASNVSTIHECSERLNELPCSFTSPEKQTEAASDPVREPSPQIENEQLSEELTEPHTPEDSGPIEPMDSEITEQQPNSELDLADGDSFDTFPLSKVIPEPDLPVSASSEESLKESIDKETTETQEHEVTPPLDSVSMQQLPVEEEEAKTTLEAEKGVIPQSASSLEIMQEQMSNEEYRCWKDLLANPDEFETWVKLLALSEKHENIIVIREIFDRFLKLYPYCYGYWRKLSDLVLRLQDWTTAQQILEVAVYSIPLSIDLWLHYGTLCINQGLDYLTVATLYDRSLVTAGYEFRSDLLWEAAIHFHEMQGQTVKVFSLLRQLIATPTQLYKKHYQRYESYLSTHSTRALVSEEEFTSLSEQIESNQHRNEGSSSIEEMVRESLLDQGRQIHAATEDEISLRLPYEEKIKRPYFHVQPLEESQLQTWRSYLDFEISRKYKDRIVFLFERCMIVCALYEEMWIKYAKFLGAEHCQEARAVFQRGACYIPKSVPIHLEWSLFEENLNQLDRTRELLQSIEQKVPGLIEVKSHYVAFELRHGNKDRVDEMYKEVLQQALKQFQKSSSQSENRKLLHDMYNYWAAKYAFFLSRHFSS
eukprot:TRINITY_DN7000_c0_g1_i12.p1 TRINITY_DN7000_c0_g1~~TRINITY_DN7000_c0_g1_i12.p1  ORF type:complete len:768 (-),score=146.88 TRINITY_DN7000_c0_g1_i12:778-3081(-)